MRQARGAIAVLATLLAPIPGLLSCASREGRPVWSAIRERYFVGFLKRNPITSTYLGGDGASPDLGAVNGVLPDVTPRGRAEAVTFYRSVLADLERIDPRTPGPDDRID